MSGMFRHNYQQGENVYVYRNAGCITSILRRKLIMKGIILKIDTKEDVDIMGMPTVERSILVKLEGGNLVKIKEGNRIAFQKYRLSPINKG